MMFSAEIQGDGGPRTISRKLLELIVDTAQFHRLFDASEFHSVLSDAERTNVAKFLHAVFNAKVSITKAGTVHTTPTLTDISAHTVKPGSDEETGKTTYNAKFGSVTQSEIDIVWGV